MPKLERVEQYSWCRECSDKITQAVPYSHNDGDRRRAFRRLDALPVYRLCPDCTALAFAAQRRARGDFPLRVYAPRMVEQ